jgi:hypothetical protein
MRGSADEVLQVCHTLAGKQRTVVNKVLYRIFFSVCLPLALFFTQCREQAGNDPIDRHAAHLIYTRHARCRMGCRHITETEIREILEKGRVNYRKSEPYAHPDPKYALEGYSREGQHLRIIFAPSGNDLVVITCIELDVEWQCDCK